MVTLMGLARNSLASLEMAGGHVAENISVCRSLRMLLAMARMLGSKPRSSMRSASSSTKYVTRLSLMLPSSMRSWRRPGVATTKPTPARMASFCAYLGTPPYTHTLFTPHLAPASSRTSWICTASSRVGERMRHTGPWLPGALPTGSWSKMCARAGRPKPRVLPEPVEAMATASRPDITIGQHCDWMGEGCVKVRVLWRRFGATPSSVNLVIGLKNPLLGSPSTVIPLLSRKAMTSPSVMVALSGL
mmetsp:Transcript_57034/g.180540  ORF Transcript_57034/g.180540 Transcript_57034/m.180540 type:complete len:246 (-) Transcript_57034:158-895(-)